VRGALITGTDGHTRLDLSTPRVGHRARTEPPQHSNYAIWMPGGAR
jgi:hypothetical protein